MNVGIIGAGYIGLPLAAVSASETFVCNLFDVDKNKIYSIKNNSIKFEEDEVDRLLKEKINKGQIQADIGLKYNDIYIICVPTPAKIGETYNADLSIVQNAMDNILKILSNNISDSTHIVIESTCPCGTADFYQNYFDDKIGKGKVCVWTSPERILPGNSINELKNNQRLLGYSETSKADPQSNIVLEFYTSFMENKPNVCKAKVAELAKLFENSSRDVGIALANEFKKISLDNDVNPNEVIDYANLHPRVEILKPGIGVGGHCIPVDPLFLKSKETYLLNTARQINDEVPKELAMTIKKYLNKFKLPKPNEKILLLGKSYKPNCIDTRNSPALMIYNYLLDSFDNDSLMIADPFLDGKDSIYLKHISLVLLLVDHHGLYDEAIKWYGENKVVRLTSGFVKDIKKS